MLNKLYRRELLQILTLLFTVLVIGVLVWFDLLNHVFFGTILLMIVVGAIFFINGHPGSVLLIYLVGLPVYTLTLVLLYRYTGSMALIKLFQPWKEVIGLGLLLLFGFGLLHNLKIKRFHALDYLILLYFCWNVLYLVFPQGPSFVTRLFGLRSLAFFVVIYGLGRLIPLNKKQQKWVLWGLVFIGAAAGIMVIIEKLFLSDSWLVPFGLMTYLQDFYNVSPVGHYGLTWTFETAGGIRRYSSFFANPLELASSTLITGVAAIAAYFYYQPRTRGRMFAGISFCLIVISLLLSISRSSTIAFFMQMIFLFFLLKKRLILQLIVILSIIGLLFVLINPTLRAFAWDTFTFENSSSKGHLIGWVEGRESILQEPLGLGLGVSGNVGSRFGKQVGGENQFIIVGVQTGLVGSLLYIAILFLSIWYSLKAYCQTTDIAKLLVLIACVSKIGILLPTFTANIEIYIFTMFISWWLIGFSIQQLSRNEESKNKNLTYLLTENPVANSY